MSNEKQKKILARFFPDGRAWEKVKESFLIDGIAWEFKRVGDSIIELQNEIFPQTTVNMITDFEQMLDIDNSSLSLDERRLAVIEKMSVKGSMKLSDFYFAAEKLGVIIKIVFQYPFRVGINRIGDRLYGLEWQYYVFIEVFETPIETLRNSLEKIKPAFTELVFYKQSFYFNQSIDLPQEYFWTITFSESLGLYVACVLSGIQYHSPDGLNWTAASNPISSSWRGVAWSPELNLFAAVSSSGAQRVATSPDGNIWTLRNATSSTSWQSIIWVSELLKFFAVGSVGNSVMYSSNGIDWTEIDPLNGSAGQIYDVTFSPELGLLCAVAGSGNISTSSDGINWNTYQTPDIGNNYRGVVWSPELSLFCAVSWDGTNQVAYSSDGINWTMAIGIGVNSYWTKISWSPDYGLFVAVAYGGTERVMISNDAINWRVPDIAIDANDYRDIVYSHSLKEFAAIASTGTNRVNTFGFEKVIL